MRKSMDDSSSFMVPQTIEEVKGLNVLMEGKLTNGEIVEIVGYDLELGKFDCTDNETRVFDQFDSFKIPSHEFESISERLRFLIEEHSIAKLS